MGDYKGVWTAPIIGHLMCQITCTLWAFAPCTVCTLCMFLIHSGALYINQIWLLQFHVQL